MSQLFVTSELLMMTCWKGIFHTIKLYVCQIIERKGRGEGKFRRFLDFNFVGLVLGPYNMLLHKPFLHSLSRLSFTLCVSFSLFWMFLDDKVTLLVTWVSKMWYLPVNDGFWVWLNTAPGWEIKTVEWWVQVRSCSKAQGRRYRGMCSKHSDSS